MNNRDEFIEKPDASSFAEKDFENADFDVNRRRVYRRKPKNAANLVSQLIAHRGIAQSQNANEIANAWEFVVGDLSKRTRTGNLRRGTLEVHVVNSIIMQQLSFKKQSILADLQQQLPNKKISDLNFRIGKVN